jgi:hypothetical protein
MGKLPESPLEVRLAATFFLLLMGLANLFGAWQVGNFASFTPSGVAGAFRSSEHEGHPRPAGVSEEKRIDPASLNVEPHRIGRELLVQDSHVHVPVFAMAAAFFALIVSGLRLSQRVRIVLVLAAFAAPVLDFAGLWGAHLWSGSGRLWGAVAVFGGCLMGLVYLVVLVLTLKQCWFPGQGEAHA